MKGEFIDMNKNLCNNSIYDFESNLAGSQIVEKITDKKMYDIRKMENRIKELGRPLSIDETDEFLIVYENEMEK